MKKWFLFLLLLSFVSASVDVGNYSIESVYLRSDKITGSVDLTIVNEDYNEEIVLSNGSKIVLGDFLIDNEYDVDCSPVDCSMGYSSFSPETVKSIVLQPSQERYLGFVLTGDDVVLTDISFKVSTSFGEAFSLPLAIELFEDEQWKFDKFSDNFLPRNYGCFNPSASDKKVGPLIDLSFYCEMISIGDTDKLHVGANVSGGGQGELDMTVYTANGFRDWDCSFDPNVAYGCIIEDIGEIFSGGDYKVCIGAADSTDYRIYTESSGVNCGFPYDAGPIAIVKDYSIFAHGVKYAATDGVLDLTLSNRVVGSANSFIEERYGRNCSEGCILPLKISGISQSFKIYDVELRYTDNYETDSSDLVYDLNTIPAKIDFNGILNLNLLNIVVSRPGEYFAELLGEDLFRGNIKLFTVPVILSVSPLNPSAGIPILFYADVDFDGNAALSYEWSFGDGESAKTSNSSVVHTYDDLGNYSLTLRVIPGGNLMLSSIDNFTIETISPEDALATGLLSKKAHLTNVRAEVKRFSAWYEKDLLGILEVANFESELSRLEKVQSDSFDDVKTLVDVINGIYRLDVPVDVWRNSFESSFLIPDSRGIDIEGVVAISGESVSGTNRDYVGPILAWQEENVDVLMKFSNVFASSLRYQEVDILSAYRFDIVSRGRGESYFVIDVPLSELHFNKDVGARGAGSSTVIVLNEGEKKIIEFYYEGVDSASFFVSPKLSSFVVESDITGVCNFNKVCEKSLGENSENCRNDCKPVKKAIWFFVIGFIVFLFLYTMLQIWYKRHYEAYLFKDNVQMYNLLMYVTNARARKMKDGKISSDLRAKGWSSERINYVIRKSAGKSIGMIEIIPIEFILALLRKRKAKKIMGATAPVPQQNNANIK